MRDYKVLIFDWDGTLVDSIARIVDAMHLAALACGLSPCSDEATKGIIGLGLPEAIQVLHPELHESERLADFQRFYSEHYLAFEAQPSALFPDVRESLKEFRDQGYRLAVATGKSRRGLARVLAEHDWLDYFDITRCADETASKPDPMMLQEILAYCQAAPHEALMVGDSIFDLQMARRAGIDSVAVGYGAQSLSVLRAQSPQLAIGAFHELRAWLGAGANEHSIEVNGYVG